MYFTDSITGYIILLAVVDLTNSCKLIIVRTKSLIYDTRITSKRVDLVQGSSNFC